MPVILVGRWNTVGSTNDLKPESLMVERRMRIEFLCFACRAKPDQQTGGILSHGATITY
jgi:hypothetical protein